MSPTLIFSLRPLRVSTQRLQYIEIGGVEMAQDNNFTFGEDEFVLIEGEEPITIMRCDVCGTHPEVFDDEVFCECGREHPLCRTQLAFTSSRSGTIWSSGKTEAIWNSVVSVVYRRIYPCISPVTRVGTAGVRTVKTGRLPTRVPHHFVVNSTVFWKP